MLRLFIALMIFFPSAAFAAGISGRDVIRKMDDLLWGDTAEGLYEMTVTTPDWERTLKMRAWESRRERTFIRILSPQKERGVTTLRIGNEMWNYLPGVERIIKIPPSMMLQSWMGSDFTNDDLVKESSVVNDYDHDNTGIVELEGVRAYRVEAAAKKDAPVVWGKIIYWVRESDFVPLREEFYNEKGALVRVMTFSEVKLKGGRTIPTRWEMRPVKKPGRATVFKILDIEFNKNIPDGIFTKRNMATKDFR